MSMSQRELGQRLGLSKSQVSKLAARGMPTHDVAAADAWRRHNVMPQWRKSAPAQPETSPARAQLDLEQYEALKLFWTQHALSASAFSPVTLAGTFRDAGVDTLKPELVMRFAEMHLYAIMEFACHLLGDEELAFALPEWACGDDLDRDWLLMQIEEVGDA
jgi:hypothetical protein